MARRRREGARGCPDCGRHACGDDHVYVIEITDDPNKDFYVGYTNHTVECNFENGHKGEKGEEYRCSCFNGETAWRDCNTRQHTYGHRMKLRYDLFDGFNPVPKGTGEKHEKALARQLKKRFPRRRVHQR